MTLSDFRTTNVDNAINAAWEEWRKASSSPHFGGCGVAPTPSEFAINYACLIQVHKAAKLKGSSAKAHLIQRAIRQVGLMTDDTLRNALDHNLIGIPAMPVDLDALNAPLKEAQEFYALDNESRPIQLAVCAC